MNSGPLTGSPADADCGSLAEALLRGVWNTSLVGDVPERGDDPDLSAKENAARHDADLGIWPAVITPGQIGPMRRDCEPQSARLTFTSRRRNTLGDATMSGISASIARKWCRRRRPAARQSVGVSSRSWAALRDGVDHRQVQMRRAALAGRGPPPSRAVGDRLLGMEGPLLPVKPSRRSPWCICRRSNWASRRPLHRLDDLLGGVVEVVGAMT